MSRFITTTLCALAALMLALLGVGLFGSEYASGQQITLLGLSLLTGFAATIRGYWALGQ